MIKINYFIVTLRTFRSSFVNPYLAIGPARRLIHTTAIQLTPQRPQKPPLGKHKLPPPPPLARVNLKQPSVPSSSTTMLPWKTLDEILSVFVEYVPTYYVPIQGVAAIMPEEIRAHFQGRGKLISFFRRQPFLFELRNLESGSRIHVRLQEGVSHPRCGVADQKYMMTDIGVVESYVAKPEFIVSMDSIENPNKGVSLHPQSAPPAIRVQLEERVPILDQLVTFIPVDFEHIKNVEENIPDDILFHSYFDCQGGLSSIASKFPDDFQVVDGKIRRRPPHLAPLSLNDFTLKQSPIPEIASLVEREVCNTDIPRWVNITSLYEQLTPQQKKEVKQQFKSFAGFLRAHGRSVSVSQDMLCVSMWLPPPAAPTDAACDGQASTASSVDASAQCGSEACIGETEAPRPTCNGSDPVNPSNSRLQEPFKRNGIPSDVPAPHLKTSQTTPQSTH
ncbi:unnamed protein product [Phytomonas sp. EM1]|nr:unnamed protein product [Phytomonas sp. EM1]|eukprot:CCW61748.1 unnamed protein product [Phytomonas sp. isolate EM1]